MLTSFRSGRRVSLFFMRLAFRTCIEHSSQMDDIYSRIQSSSHSSNQLDCWANSSNNRAKDTTSIPPALAAWSFSFDLPRVFDETIDTTRFSGVESQFRATTSVRGNNRYHPLQRRGVSVSRYHECSRKQ